MQRPSFALAVLFGALASGLLVANVAPCQVIVVFHDVRVVQNTSQDRAADSAEGPAQPEGSAQPESPAQPESQAQPEYAPADQPAVSAPPAVTVESAPPSDASPTDSPLVSDALRDAAPSPVALTPAVDAAESAPVSTDTAPLPQWLGTGDADPLDAMPPVESAPVASSETEVEGAAPIVSETAQSAPAEQSLDAERADLLENTAKKVGEAAALGVAPDASGPIPRVATTIPEERPASEKGSLVEPELAAEAHPAMSLEPLRDAARDVAITLDGTAVWVQSAANSLRAWADRDANDPAP